MLVQVVLYFTQVYMPSLPNSVLRETCSYLTSGQSVSLMIPFTDYGEVSFFLSSECPLTIETYLSYERIPQDMPV